MPRTTNLTIAMMLALLAVAAGAQTAPAARRSSPSLHDWLGLASVDAPNISPNGEWIAYTLSTPDWSSDNFDTEVWVVGSDGKGRRQVTDEKGANWSPRWSPDGTALAFLSSRKGPSQVFMVRMPAGEPLQVTSAGNGIDDFRWSPDGRHIAYISGESIGTAAAEPKEFHVVGNDGKSSAALWLVDVAAVSSSKIPEAVRLTDAKDIAADEIVWSPDSRRIAFHANKPAAPYSFWTYDIFVLDVESRTVKQVVNTPGPDFWPVWSPDGKEIAYRAYLTSPDSEYYTHSMGFVAVVSADGGTPRFITDTFDEQSTPVAWGTDGIYFVARQRTYQHLYRVDPKTKVIERVSGPPETISASFSFTPDMRSVAYLEQDAQHYQEVFSSPLGRQLTPTRVTHVGDQLAGWLLAERSIVTWTSKDGTPIEGVLLKPPHFDPARRYPIVVIAHGGPVDASLATITRDMPYVAEMYAQKDMLVLRPNYRGSTGYGAAFRAALIGNLGVKEYEDVVSGVDMLVRRGWADSARVGLMGWSHGGYISAFSATYGNRFTAISVGAGVSDFRVFHTLGAGSTVKPSKAEPSPWDAPEYFRAIAPLTYVKNARTPTLIQHGENDQTAPIVSATELYNALREQGVNTKMIIYRGAGHLPNGLAQYQIVAQHNLDWFGQWLVNRLVP